MVHSLKVTKSSQILRHGWTSCLSRVTYFEKELDEAEVNIERLFIASRGLLQNEVDDVVIDGEDGIVKHVVIQVQTFVGF